MLKMTSPNSSPGTGLSGLGTLLILLMVAIGGWSVHTSWGLHSPHHNVDYHNHIGHIIIMIIIIAGEHKFDRGEHFCV